MGPDSLKVKTSDLGPSTSRDHCARVSGLEDVGCPVFSGGALGLEDAEVVEDSGVRLQLSLDVLKLGLCVGASVTDISGKLNKLVAYIIEAVGNSADGGLRETSRHEDQGVSSKVHPKNIVLTPLKDPIGLPFSLHHKVINDPVDVTVDL